MKNRLTDQDRQLIVASLKRWQDDLWRDMKKKRDSANPFDELKIENNAREEIALLQALIGKVKGEIIK